jgi:hypothetical protein
VWVANLTDQIENVQLEPKWVGMLSVLSALEFEQAAQDFSAMDSLEQSFDGEKVTLPPYAVARFRGRCR